ncbi:4Fe-4S dicluster domain-containing protein [Desulforamulus hydrothermalis]|uniref:4Fe-4S ferredoxin iron-sulfur binding domain-containing protein n=1 Tax=Desulforamulus hydrothermalis Lam5 = DSM 18033 TaxID=1121428 RepID=K8DWU3_9FIRM|nr:4Fe-4S dicluster domain-containing protein [Desulforamulus hydrothermalis]CCO06937.1 4Fe-4S ferredoxin iron-sulfur binding domain-containing protein [Desulforamulus hydrothermalis Lam5 = DSM 18033]SHG99137.1 Fe-S-cluster-containing dehydrogenase component [Desulforamulus hydrothermalis Lam5 = DSM 18033]
MAGLSRREFIKRSVAGGVAGSAVLYGFHKPAAAAAKGVEGSVGTFIDLSQCNGCAGQSIPACVAACRAENQAKYPNPVPSQEIPYYWPNKNKKEDWQDKKHLTDRLTPYNWLFVQKVKVVHAGKEITVSIPRRCMHCENPPCANLCPFGAQYKTAEGVTLINKDLCLGGAKCRDVCPWGIPARQAGVGLYMKMAPRYLGAGVMYKCDLCYDRIKVGQKPACVEACPQGAIYFGLKKEMKELARKRAKEINGYLYGDAENGGTSTFYVAPVPFEKIHQALQEEKSRKFAPSATGYPLMPVKVGNFLDTANGLLLSALAAPVAGAFLAGFTAYQKMRGGE